MKAPTLRDLFPTLNNDQLQEVEEMIDEYLALVVRIYERIIREKGHDGFRRMLKDARKEVCLRDKHHKSTYYWQIRP
jgi:hypothetical protein